MEMGTKIRKNRSILGIVLLSLLAICGVMGFRREAVQTVSLPVSRTGYELSALQTDSAQSARVRLAREREKEIEMLRCVAGNEASDDALRRDALAQIVEVSGRMELETQVEACLEEMGYAQALPVCSAQGITIICPGGSVGKEEDRLRVIDAVCSVSGYEAGDIKIILAKK